MKKCVRVLCNGGIFLIFLTLIQCGGGGGGGGSSSESSTTLNQGTQDSGQQNQNNVVFTGPDTDLPVIVQGIQLEKTQINAGEAIQFTLKIKDEGSGFSTFIAEKDDDNFSRDGIKKGDQFLLTEMRVYIHTPGMCEYCADGIILKVDSIGTDGTMTLSGQYRTFAYDQSGSYEINGIYFRDRAGNKLSLSASGNNFTKIIVHVDSVSPDTDLPVIVQGIQLEKTQINAGEAIQFTLKIKA